MNEWDRRESLRLRIDAMLGESKDSYFTEYLTDLLRRLTQDQAPIQDLEGEFARNYNLYRERMQHAARQERGRAIEYNLAVASLGLVGSLFLLVSFVILGMNFMNGFIKGMSLYGLVWILILVGELIFAKRSKKLGMVLSATGICGLYLATMVNYMSLRNFGGITAVLVSTLISALVFWHSRRRKWYFLRLLGMLAGYITIIPVWNGAGGADLLVLSSIILLLNAMCAMISLPRSGEWVDKLHMMVNSLFTLLLLIGNPQVLKQPVYGCLLVLSAPVITNLIFYRMMKRKDTCVPGNDPTLFFGLSMGMNLIGFGLLNLAKAADLYTRGGLFAGLAVGCLVFFVLLGKQKEGWFQYMIVMLGASLSFLTRGDMGQRIVALLILLFLAKVLGRIPEKSTGICDMVLTVLTCMACVRYVDTLYMIPLVGALVLSVLFIRRWQTAYEILITVTLAYVSIQKVPKPLEPVAVFSILFLGILLFHKIPVLRGRGIGIYNKTALAGMVLCLMTLVDAEYGANPYVYGILLMLGIAVATLTFQEEYGMNFKGKHLILAGFLTYMVLVCRLGHPIWVSILLMVVAVASVGMGFYRKEKALRIYGLVLALFVCGKVTLYDFFGADTLHKMLLFFGVGLLALTIAGIYIILEKKRG